ncbi:putative Ig domain-containing protein [Pedobacter sp. Leaf250]|uniref:Ig-like domain-containing protein n=1 Tax=Pedobacter sp. Leaf250 TaxID=2876559 RepID=UPI001E52892D|nr:putative Ig domain-containing protein [Pedobacter sp. Leaf250]
MMKTFTSHSDKGIIRYAFAFAIITLLTFFGSISYAQTKIFATSVTEIKPTTGSPSRVDNINDAISTSDATFATLNSYGGVALGIGSYYGGINLKFPNSIPANKTTYIRIDFDQSALNGLLGGTLGGLVADIVGGLVIGNHQFEVGAQRPNGTTILSRSSALGFNNNSNIKIVKDKNGQTFIAITPNETYDKVYIIDRTTGVLLTTTGKTNVYYAYTIDGNDNCDVNTYANYDEVGISLDALNLAGAENFEFQKAIDNDKNTFYNLSTGVVGVAASKSVNVYFPSLSNTTDNINLRFRTSPALVNLKLFDNLRVTAYNGSDEVYNVSASSLLDLDLLGLLNNGQAVTVPFAPGVAFDRVSLRLSTLVSANVTQYVELYDISRSPAFPTFAAPVSNTINACYNASANLQATTAVGNQLVWYDVADGGTSLATVNYNGTFTTPVLTSNKTYYVASKRSGCTAESVRVPVNITVNPIINFTGGTLTNATSGSNYNKQLVPATGGTPGFTYSIASGSVLPAGLTLSSTGDIVGRPTVPNTYNFSVVATDTKGCSVTAAYTLIVTGPLTLLPGALPEGITNILYPTQTIPAANGGTGPYTYTATDVPAGLTFNEATREITGTPTVPGNNTVRVTVTDANGNTVTSNYTLKITDPFILPPATLANGTTGISYIPQTIPSAVGGTGPYTYSATGLPPGLTFTPGTRVIAGTPSLAGNYPVSVTATDADGKTVTTIYSITVLDPLALPQTILADGNEKVNYPPQTILPATGGSGSYTYVASNLPAGITFDASTRVISGTPAQAGNYSILVTVTDDGGRTANRSYSLKVIGALNLPSATLADGTVGTTYPAITLPAVSGGTQPYIYTATGLPQGITFNPNTREISGTPEVGGTYGISLTATDAANNSATTTYTLNVNINAPIVASVTVCSGTGATLTVSNTVLVGTITYRLYGPTGNTPLQTNTTGSFTTPAVSTQTTFYVDAVSGTAVSTRTTAIVSINPPATLPSVASSNIAINSGQTATLNATFDAGNTIAWYEAATGGSPVSTNATFTTPPLTTNKTYYAQTTSAAGCASASRVPVVITVVPVSGTTACNTAGSQNTAITGICVLCGITGAGNSTDADPNNFTRLTLGVGVGAVGSQQLIFQNPGVATDSIRLNLGIPGGLADVNVLNNITVKIFNGTTEVKSVQISGGLLSINLLGGGRFSYTLAAGGAYDRVQVSFGGVVAALSSLDIYGATQIYPNPTIISGSQSICAGSTAKLSVTPVIGTTVSYFDSLISATVLNPDGGDFTTPALSSTTTYYLQVNKVINGSVCSNPTRTPITITVNPAILFNGLTLKNASISFPYNQQLPLATGGTPGFAYALAAGSTLPAGLSLSSTGLIYGTPTAVGNPTFSVVATDTKNCSTTAVFNLTVTPALALAPGTLPDGITGTLYPSQTIPAASGGTGPITYSAADVPPGLSFNPATREISGTPTQPGNYIIPITVTDANGYSVTSNYTLKVTDPLLLPPATLANGTTGLVYPTQTIPLAIGGTQPYTYAATGVPAGLTFNPSTREISGIPTQSGTYPISVTVTDFTGKTATTTYNITIIDPLTLPPATLADGNENVNYPTQTIPSAIGGVGPYTYTAINLPPGLNFNTSTREITGLPTQAGNYFVTVNVADSEGRTATNNYAIKIIGALNLPSATLPNGVVGTAYPTQTLPEVTGGTGPYTYIANNLPPGLNFNTITREITGEPSLGGDYTISLTARDESGNVATTGYSIKVTVNSPIVANAAVCAGSAATLTVSNLVAGVTYNWYAATGTTPLATNNTGTFTTPAVTAQTVFYVEAVSGTAISSRTAVTVSINPPATLATVTTNNQVINPNQSTTLLATADAGNTITWFDAATAGTQVGSGASFTTPLLSATTTYYVETTNSNGCASASRVPVTVTVIPVGSGTACNAANSQTSGITGVCLLCGITGAGNSTDTNPDNFTRITLAVGVASTGFQQLRFPISGTATDSVRLDLALPGGLLDLQVLNNTTVTILNGTTVVRTVQLGSSLVNLRLLSGTRFAASILGGAPFDRVEVRFGGLVSAVTSLDIYGATITYPAPTITAGSQTICSSATATLTATANGGTAIAWYDAAGTELATGASYTTPALTATATYYIQVSRATCANPVRIPVTVTVTPALTTPVVATVTASCAGSPTTLSVTNPIAGVTYNWFSVQNGGTPVLTGATVTTPALTASTTYYVEAAQGNCVSTGRTTVIVPVNPAPALPTLTTSSSSVAPGQTAILTASSSETNVTFNWYNSATSTTPVYVGPTYVTPSLTATTTYYVEAVSANGCASLGRAQITVTVNTGGSPNPVPCESATAQTNGVVGLGLLAGVFNPGLAIDNDTQTGSSLILPVGALGGSVFQRASFGSVSRLGDTVRVLVSAPGRLLSLAVLGNTQITTYLGTTSNGDSRTLNSGLLNVQLLSGDTQALITFVPSATFDGVEIRLNGGVATALSSLNFNYAQRILVAPTVVSANVTACVGQTTQLTVSNPSSNLTYRWYDAAGTYLTGKDGIIFTTPVLTGDTKFFVTAVSASGCVSYRTVVNVTTNPAPVPPVLLSPTVNTCSGASVVLQVSNPVAGTTYRWYDSANVYQAGFDGPTFTVSNVTANTTFSVEAVNNCGVASTKATATINIGNIDIPIITPSAVTISQNSVAVLKATSSIASAIITWYDAPSGGILLSTGETFVTAPLTTTTTFYAEANAGACSATGRASVVVTVVPNGTPVPTPCGAAISQTNGVTGGVSIGAGVINPNNAIDGDINTGSSLVIPVGLLGSSVYQRLKFAQASNVGDTLRLKITTPGQLLSLALLPNVTVTTYLNGSSTGNVTTLSNPLISLKLLAGNNSGILTIIPTSQFDEVELRLNAGLLGALTSINLDYAQRTILAPTLSTNNVSTCLGTAATLSVQNPQPGVIYKWYRGTDYQTGKDGITFLTDPALPAGTYEYFVTANANGCETVKVGATVIVLSPPAPPTATADNPASTCLNSPVELSVIAVAGNTYNWYDQPTGGNMLVTNNNKFLTPANLPVGTKNYYVELVNANGCSSSTRTVVSITVNDSALAGDITVIGNTSLCAAGTTTLTASSSISIAVFNWYSDAALTQLVASNTSTYTTPTITAPTKYYVTVSGTGKCANTAGNAKEVTINFNPIAVATDITLTGPTSICAGATVSLRAQANVVNNAIFTWYSDAALTTIVNTTDTFSPTVTATTTYYVTVKGSNRCENTAATAKSITITVNPYATDADIVLSGITSICKGSSATLSASSTTVINPIFTWYTDASLSTPPIFTGASFNTGALNASATYYVTVKGDNKCENQANTGKAIAVTVNEYATAADITVANTQICAGSTALLVASSLTITQPVFTWYNDPSLTSIAFVGPIFTVNNLTSTTTYYITVKGANKCENTAADAKVVVVTVNPLATPTDIIVNGGTTACAGASATLTADSPNVTNSIFTWYSDAALTNITFVGKIFTTPALNTTTTYYVTVKGDNKCENAAGNGKAVLITITPVANATDVVVSDASICAGSSAALVASTTTVNDPIFTWYNDAALTSVAFVGATFNTPTLSATTIYYLTIKGSNRCESSASTAKVVTVTVNEVATAADITLSTPAVVCGSGTATINASSSTVTSPVFTWYNDASLTSVAFVGPIFTTPSLSATTTYYVTVKGANKCESSAANAKAVTVIVNPIASASDIITNGTTAVCNNSTTTLTATTTTVTNPIFTWYSDAVLNNVVFTGASFTTPVLTSNTTYYVTVKGDNKCENTTASAKPVAIVVTPVANATDVVASDASICAGSPAALVASTTTVNDPIFTWYNDAALTSVAFVGATFNTPTLSATTKYYLTIKGSNRCESSASTAKVVAVTVNEVATAADITLSTPAVVCGSGTATINASSSTVTSPVFTWYNDASLTSVAFVGPIFTTPSLSATTTYYVTVKGANKCESSAANAKAVTVIVNPIAVTTDIAVSGSRAICTSGTTTLTATSSTVINPIFTWYSNAGLTNVAAVGSVFTTPVLATNTTYYVTVRGDNKCENAPANAVVVDIIVAAIPNSPIIATTGTNICSGEPTTLSITNSQNGVTYEWYTAATGGSLLFTGTSYTTSVINTATDYYVQAVGAGGCTNSGGRVKVTVTVNQKPNVPTVTSSNVSVCIGNSAALTVSNPQANIVYNWYTTPNGGTIAGTGSSFTTPALTANATYYVEGANGSCLSSSRTPVNVIALPVPVAPTSVTAANGTICAGSNTILTVNNPVSGLIYRWYTVSSNGNSIGEGITFTTPNITTTTIFYVESIAVGGCASPTRTPVTVNVLPVLNAPVVVVQSTTPNSVTFAWAAVNGASGYEVSTDNGLTWLAASGTSYLTSGLKPDQSVTIIVRAKGQLDCQTSANSTPITGKASNPLGNQIYIPNAFTPNNDGKNDVFLIYGNTIVSAKMSIYTQWGQLIYQSDNVANGWDGTFRGVNQPIGVYVYMVEVQLTDGSTVIKKGTVTLLR